MNPHLHSNTTIVSINLKMNHLMLLIGENSNTTIVSINPKKQSVSVGIS